MTNAEAKVLYDELVAVITREIPGFKIRFKTDSRLQKLIGFVLRWVIPFNRRYMTDYTSTFYPDVFFPSRSRSWPTSTSTCLTGRRMARRPSLSST
jgi:hypothetical protein